MTSGAWITTFLLVSVFLVFPLWEGVQLLRRRAGNKSAKTLSQYVVGRAKSGSKFWRVFIVGFPILLMLIGLWLLFHFEGFCHVFLVDFICDISKRA
jgi:hypothetical protein